MDCANSSAAIKLYNYYL